MPQTVNTREIHNMYNTHKITSCSIIRCRPPEWKINEKFGYSTKSKGKQFPTWLSVVVYYLAKNLNWWLECLAISPMGIIYRLPNDRQIWRCSLSPIIPNKTQKEFWFPISTNLGLVSFEFLVLKVGLMSS